MSKNRKNRLRKLTSAMLGALGMAGSVANMNTNADAQQETSLLARTGVTVGIGTGIALTALTAYNTFKDKKDPTDEEYKKLLLENAKLAKDEADKQRENTRKQEELKEKYGLSDQEITNVAANINGLRTGKPAMSPSEILSTISGMQYEQDIIDSAKGANNVNNQRATANWIRMEIADKLTLEDLNKAIKEVVDVEKAEQRLDMLTTVQLTSGGASTSTIHMPKLSTGGALPGGGQFGQFLGGSLNPIRNNQKRAADAIMPEKVRHLFGGCWGMSLPCPTLGKELSGVQHTPYKNLFVSNAVCNDGNNTDAGRRNFTLAGWQGGAPGQSWNQQYMNISTSQGLSGMLGMDVIVGPDCNSHKQGVNIKSGGLGLGMGLGKIEHLKKLSRLDIKQVRQNLFTAVYTLVRS